jgi:hypothetical protein
MTAASYCKENIYRNGIYPNVVYATAVPGEVLECQKPVTVELFEIIYSQSQIQESL